MGVVVGLLTGFIFGLGIVISGMANPAKVLNFFDVLGTWDPSLAFVMGGALLTTLVGYSLVFMRAKPVFDDRFHLPSRSDVDARLIFGAAIFGVGWGIAGFCPGAALPVVGTMHEDVLVFVAAMVSGIVGTRVIMDEASKTGERVKSRNSP